MPIKEFITEIEIKSEHMGFLNIIRKEDNPEMNRNKKVWLEISNDENYPLIINNANDIDELCKALQNCKKLLEK